MKEVNYKGIIRSIKGQYGEAPQVLDYEIISENLQRTIKDVTTTQRIFDVKQKLETGTFLGYAFNTYISIMRKLGDTKFGKWGHLFSTQLNHVDFLNQNLKVLIKGGEAQTAKIQYALDETIQNAKEHNSIRLDVIRKSPEINKRYENAKERFEKLTENDPEFYDVLQEKLQLEGKVLDTLHQVDLTGSHHNLDMQKIEFLRRYISLQRGLLFSAKDLQIGTQQIIETLDHLIDTYENMSNLSNCIGAIYEGVSGLRGYTEELGKQYQITANRMESIRSSSSVNMLGEASNQMNPIVRGMLDNLQEDMPSTIKGHE